MKTNRILPIFPRTPHIPCSTNLAKDDIVATYEDVSSIWSKLCVIEEKIDGASVGMGFYEDQPVIRNRDHVLRKGYTKDTAAKKQFSSIWNWFYSNKEKFIALNEIGPLVVYGEWMIASHGIHYDSLPDWFIAYDLFDYETSKFYDPIRSRKILTDLGFSIPQLHFDGQFNGVLEELSKFCDKPSLWTQESSEGIYLKLHDNDTIVSRFKMVKPEFRRGFYWDHKKITKNKLRVQKFDTKSCIEK